MSYGDMQTRLASEMARTDLTTEIQNEIQSAILFYTPQRFWFNEEKATIQCTNGERYYALPTDFQALDNLSAQVAGTPSTGYAYSYRLKQRTEQYLSAIDFGTTNWAGYPQEFALYANQLRLYPPPLANVQLTLSYIQVQPPLVNTTDTNEWMEDGEELIRHRAASQLFANYLMNPQMAQARAQLEQMALLRMRQETANRIMSGKVMKSRF